MNDISSLFKSLKLPNIIHKIVKIDKEMEHYLFINEFIMI